MLDFFLFFHTIFSFSSIPPMPSRMSLMLSSPNLLPPTLVIVPSPPDAHHGPTPPRTTAAWPRPAAFFPVRAEEGERDELVVGDGRP